MIKRNFTSAALIAAGMLVAATAANAIVVDLEHNDSGSAGGPTPALFQVTFQQPTGTGVIDPFLTIQNKGAEQGYNTSGNPAPFDIKRQPQYTHDIQFSDLQSTAITINGVAYFQILLDVNESKSTPLITLDRLQVYTSPQGSQTTTNVSTLGTLRYDLDFGGMDNQVLIDYSRNHGSGSGDVNIFIPVSDFAGTAPTDFVYLYAAFGTGGATTVGQSPDAGFEEFSLVTNVTPVPEMSALFPIVGLMVAVGSTHMLRRRKMAQASV